MEYRLSIGQSFAVDEGEGEVLEGGDAEDGRPLHGPLILVLRAGRLAVRHEPRLRGRVDERKQLKARDYRQLADDRERRGEREEARRRRHSAQLVGTGRGAKEEADERYEAEVDEQKLQVVAA